MKVKREKKRNPGVIIIFLNFINTVVIKYLCEGFFGKVFTSYDTIETRAKKGIILGSFSRAPGGRQKSIRRKALLMFDNSLVINLLRRLVKYLRGCKLNFYGAFFGTFGLYSLIVFLIRFYIENGNNFSSALLVENDFICSLLIMLASIPLLTSKRALSTLVNESVTARTVFEDAVGMSDDKFNDDVVNGRNGAYFVAVIVGMLAAGVTYFVSPLTVIMVLVALFVSALVFNFPEIGVLGTIFVAPFLGFFDNPTMILGTMVGVTAISYFAKFIVGKRAFTVRMIDLLVMLFMLLMLLGGVITMGGAESLRSALMYVLLMMGYLLVVNLINTEEWIEKCTAAIAIPSALMAAYGVVGYTMTNMPSKWLDASMFGEIAARTVSTFENPNMLATYLVITMPFIWRYLKKDDVSVKGKIIAAIGSLISAACMILTWSRGGWIGIIVAIIVFCLVNYRHSLKYLLVAGVLSPIWISLIPANIVSRFSSIGNLADTSTYYRLYTWKGSLNMLSEYFMGGIGVGESAFSQIYPLYAYVGIETTMHSHNLFLQIAVELGIIGLLMFLLIMFMAAQRGFGSIKQSAGSVTPICTVSAGIAGIAGALVHGMVDHIWYNYRVFFMFWIVVAVVCACSNVYSKSNAEEKVYEEEIGRASLDIVFGG